MYRKESAHGPQDYLAEQNWPGGVKLARGRKSLHAVFVHDLDNNIACTKTKRAHYLLNHWNFLQKLEVLNYGGKDMKNLASVEGWQKQLVHSSQEKRLYQM